MRGEIRYVGNVNGEERYTLHLVEIVDPLTVTLDRNVLAVRAHVTRDELLDLVARIQAELPRIGERNSTNSSEGSER